jgi:hypothetical protein
LLILGHGGVQAPCLGVTPAFTLDLDAAGRAKGLAENEKRGGWRKAIVTSDSFPPFQSIPSDTDGGLGVTDWSEKGPKLHEEAQ